MDRKPGKFTYIFTTSDRDKLINAGLTVLKADTKNNIFIFLTEDVAKANILIDSIIHIYSDILTFSDD